MFPDSEYPWTRTLIVIVIINGPTHVPTLIPATTTTEITTMEIMIIVIDTDG